MCEAVLKTCTDSKCNDLHFDSELNIDDYDFRIITNTDNGNIFHIWYLEFVCGHQILSHKSLKAQVDNLYAVNMCDVLSHCAAFS